MKRELSPNPAELPIKRLKIESDESAPPSPITVSQFVDLTQDSDDEQTSSPSSLSPATTASTRPTSNRPSTSSSLSQLPPSFDTTSYEEAKEILIGPKRRGAKPGTGAGVARKAADQYSTNTSTVRSRKRTQNAPALQQDIDRAKNTERVWLHRALAAWKNTDEYKAIPKEQQKEETKKKREVFLQQRRSKFGNAPEHIIFSLIDKYKDRLLSEAQILEDRHNELLDFAAAPAKDYWRDFDESEIEDNDEEMGHPCAADSIAKERENDFGDAEQCTYDSALARKNVRQNVDALDQIAWKAYRKSIQHALVGYLVKNNFVRKISPVTVFTSTPAGNNQSFVSDGKWQALMIERGFTTPARLFTTEEIQVWRSLWGCVDEKWVSLPGPASWWSFPKESELSESEYCERYGWVAATDVPSSAYRKFWRKIQQKSPPKGWTTYMLEYKKDLFWSEGTRFDPKVQASQPYVDTGVVYASDGDDYD